MEYQDRQVQKVAFVLRDGDRYVVADRFPVDLEGGTINGNFSITPSVVSELNVPPGPLGANETWVGQWEDMLAYSAIQIALDTDVASAANGGVVEFSHNGVDVIRAIPTTIPANVQSYFHLAPQARYVRFRYTNGPVAQTRLRVSIMFAYQPPADVVQPLGSTVTDLNIGTVVRSALMSRIMSGPSTGAYLPVGNDGTGRLLVSTGLVIPQPQTDALTNAQLRAARVAVETQQSAFAALLKFEPAIGTELRADDTATDRYHGSAPDGSSTADPVWTVVRFYKDALGSIVRVRFRTGVVWDDRAVGW